MYCLPSSSNIVICLAWIPLILGVFFFFFITSIIASTAENSGMSRNVV